MSRGEVLVAVMNNPEDFSILHERGWYRIPVDIQKKRLNKRWPPQRLAFYQTKIFGDEAHSVKYYADVRDIRQVPRKDLLPGPPRRPEGQLTLLLGCTAFPVLHSA